nr:YdbH domain-containing protein [uncultured Desulfobulbus sp.]
MLGLVAFRIPVLDRIAPQILGHLGLEPTSFSLRAIDHRHLALDSLAFKLPLGSTGLPVELQEATCTYSLTGAAGNPLIRCRAQSLLLRLPHLTDSPETEQNKQLPQLDALLPQIEHALGKIPRGSLQVEKLLIQDLDSPESPPAAFHLGYERGQYGLQLKLQSYPQQKAGLQVSIKKENDHLLGTLTLDLDRINTLLPPQFALKQKIEGQTQFRVESSPELPLSLKAELTNLQVPGCTIGQLSLNLMGSVDTARSQLTLQAPSALRLSKVKAGATTLNKATYGLAGRLDLQPERWQYHFAKRTELLVEGLRVDTTRFAQLPLRFENMLFSLDPEKMELTTALHTPLAQGALKLHCSQQRSSKAAGQCALASAKKLILAPEHSPLMLVEDKPESTIDSGTLSLNLTSQWQRSQPLSLEGTVDARVDQGTLLNIPFTGLRLRHHLQVLPKLSSKGSGLLQLDSIAGPIPCNHLLLKHRLRSGKGSTLELILEQGELALFDGQLRLANCTYALDGRPGQCTLHLRQVDLKPLIALHQVEGLSVSGRMQGQLPLSFSAQGVQIVHGVLANEAGGGIIRYQPPQATLNNSPLTTYALEALKDLHYQQLAAQLNYQPDGRLGVNLQIRGNNPEFERGRPVQLNLNTEQNLLSLLKSLQYSQSLSSKLGRRLMRSP